MHICHLEHLLNQDHGARLRVADLTDEAALRLLKNGLLSPHTLEVTLGDKTRAVELRRAYFATQISKSGLPLPTPPREAMARLPSRAFDFGGFYSAIHNTNCESVIGYVHLNANEVEWLWRIFQMDN
jgi:hypothetical protein